MAGAQEGPVRWDELFFSVSCKGTLRGMHVQASASAGHRVIFLTRGTAQDYVIDLRRGSPTFGHVETVLLKPGGKILVVPSGCAHGFEALEDETTMVYLQQGIYDPAADIGVHWQSIGIQAACSTPIVSERDRNLPEFSAFDSPFTWRSQPGEAQ